MAFPLILFKSLRPTRAIAILTAGAKIPSSKDKFWARVRGGAGSFPFPAAILVPRARSAGDRAEVEGLAWRVARGRTAAAAFIFLFFFAVGVVGVRACVVLSLSSRPNTRAGEGACVTGQPPAARIRVTRPGE